jgi:predicted NBD/HSP70 family sugar kinase
MHVAEQAMAGAAEAISTILDQNGISSQKLVGIGIATVGASDTQSGIEYRYEVMQGHITPVPIATAVALSRHVTLPVEMANKARAMASGERWFGCKLHSFLLIHAHHGVGSAVILGGYLHTGQGHAGTIGHIKVGDNGPVCSCGEQGCLEAHVNRHALLAQINRFHKLDDLYDAASLAQKGDQRIASVFCDAARLIATACAPVVDALEPEALVLVGPMSAVPQAIEAVKAYLDTHTFVGRLHRIKVLPGSFGKEAGVIGAASLAFGSIIQSGRKPDWPPA